MTIMFLKARGVSWRADGLPAFQQGICVMEFFVINIVDAEAVPVSMRWLGYSVRCLHWHAPVHHPTCTSHPHVTSPKPLGYFQ